MRPGSTKGKTETGAPGAPKATSALARYNSGEVPGFTPSSEEMPRKADDPGVIWIDPRNIVPNHFQHEEQIDPDKFEELVVSVKKEGFFHALNVNEVTPEAGADSRQPKKYFPTAGGHQRAKAAVAADIKKIPVFVDPPLDQETLAVRAGRENNVQVNRSPVNKGFLYQQMREEFGWSQQMIADRLGITRNEVNFCMMAATAAPDIQALVAKRPEDSRRAMTYLKRIKPASEEQATDEELKRCAEVRRPIIEAFLHEENPITTDQVKYVVDKVLEGKDVQEVLNSLSFPIIVVQDPIASTHPALSEVDDTSPQYVPVQQRGLPSALPLAPSPSGGVALIEALATGEEQIQDQSLVSNDSRGEVRRERGTSGSAHMQRETALSNVISRWKTYQKAVRKNVQTDLSEEERKQLELLGREVVKRYLNVSEEDADHLFQSIVHASSVDG